MSWDLVHLLVVVVGGGLACLVVHEAGHALAAIGVGGGAIRLRRNGWSGLRVEATLPRGRELEVVFLLGGPLANIGAAGALASTSSAHLHLVALLSVGCAVFTLLPVGGSDGARLRDVLRAATHARSTRGVSDEAQGR